MTRASSSRLPPLFYFALDGDPGQEMDWTGWPAALDKLGAGGVIAATHLYAGTVAAPSHALLFRSVVDRLPVGETLRNARRRLFEETSNPLGLMYVHSGPPDRRWAAPHSTL